MSYADDGWTESSDTRIAPDSSMSVAFNLVPGAVFVRGRVEVRPDAFYEGVFESLLASDRSDTSAALLGKAHSTSVASPFFIFDDTVTIER